jgi:hypothetical protein
MSDLEYDLNILIEKYGIKSILETLSFFCDEKWGKE